jgi:xanthine dehydrogenase accessory factor
MTLFDTLRQRIADEHPVALATVVRGHNIGAKMLVERHDMRHGSLGDAQLDARVHAAIPLSAGAKLLGFRVSVVDPRTTFATAERFPDVDALVTEWPDDALPQMRLDHSTYIAVLTHDPKFDDPAVRIALAHPVRYIGALGSQRTQERRKAALRETGVAEEDLLRIFGPIGLSIGAKTPAELAISILAEIVAVRRGKRP